MRWDGAGGGGGAAGAEGEARPDVSEWARSSARPRARVAQAPVFVLFFRERFV